MPRLPKPGGDSGNWGDILNEYLSVSLSSDGTLKEGLLSKDSVGLSNVDNTSDSDKPVSAAMQSALDGKLSATGGTVTGPTVFSNVDGAQRAVDITYNTSYTGVNPRGLFVAPVFTGPASGAAAAAFAPTIQNDQNITSAYGFINNLLADPQPGANVTNAMAGYQWLRTGSAGGTIGNAHGLRIAIPQIGATVPTNLYGLSVDAQNGGTNSYGVAIAEAGTASLHLSGTSGNTAAGIRFGDDTTLHRSGAAALTVNGKIATDGTAATHSLTVGASGNGLSIYNTGDQTTNFERVRHYWSGNIYNIEADNAGTGLQRQMTLKGSGTTLSIGGAPGLIISRAGTSVQKLVQISTTGFNQTIGQQFGLTVEPTIIQSGTAGYTGLLVNATESSLGTGAKNLIDMQVGNVSKMRVDNIGSTYLANGSAINHYGTSDQTTNYERLRSYWNGTIYYIATEAGGTGAKRSITINGSDTALSVGGAGVIITRNNTSVEALLRVQSNGLTASSGSQTGLSIDTTINQTASAGYVGLKMNIDEVQTGVGSKLLMDLQSNTTSRFRITSSGTVIVNGSLQFNASLRQGYGIRSSSTTLTVGNATINFCDASSGPLTITLDTAVENGTTFTIKKTDVSANNVTVVPSSGTIDGNANYVLNGQYKYVTVVAFSSGWQVIGNN